MVNTPDSRKNIEDKSPALDVPLGEKNPIPPQYRGLPSEVLEELLARRTVYVDAAKNISEQQRSQEIIAAAKQQEVQREQRKTVAVTERYARLPDAQRKEFPAAQQEATNLIRDYIQGREIVGDLQPEEHALLNSLKYIWENLPDNQKGKFFNFSEHFTGHADQKIYENLVNRLSLDVLKAAGKINEEHELSSIRESLGTKPEAIPSTKKELALEGRQDAEALKKLKEIFDKKIATVSDRPILQKSLQDLFEATAKAGDNGKTAALLIDRIYAQYRHAEYPKNAGYDEAWNFATTDKSLSISEKNGWIYRGIFPQKSEGIKTETRGSMNIGVTLEAVNEIDGLIKKGIIKANYKFGDPEMPSAGDSRHDSVSIYFLEPPTEAGLQALGEISKKYFRGNELIGKKIAEGFYMSEVGSISDVQAANLVELLKKIDQKLAAGIKSTLEDKKGRIAMSEAQYYAVKDTLELFGIDINFDEKNGFRVTKIPS